MDKYIYQKKVCFHCGEEIKPYRNIFMFQDNAFCTQICRSKKMKNNYNIKYTMKSQLKKTIQYAPTRNSKSH